MINTDTTFTAASADGFDSQAAKGFLDDGFCRVDDVIDADELQELRGLYDWCFSPDADGKVNRKALGGVDENGRQMLPQVTSPSKALPRLREFKYVSRIKQIAETVFQDSVEVLTEHMILKPAGYGVATPWHQDQSYHDPSKYYRNINFWLPLDGATVEGGCMQFVPGSHRAPVLPHTYLDPNDKQTAMVAQDQDYWSLNATAVPCPVGSCSLHHSYMLHYAGPNRTDKPRRAYIIVIGAKPTPARHAWKLPWQKRPASSSK